MSKRSRLSVLLFLLPLLLIATENWKLHTRLSFYTTEEVGRLLLLVPEGEMNKQVLITLSSSGSLLFQRDTILSSRLMQIPFSLSRLPKGESPLILWINSEHLNVELNTNLLLLPEKDNQVKVDRLTGSLITANEPFYPYGFYCYSPVQPTLAGEEVVKGFNLMSPYQKISNKTIDERQTYMDRCARLGIKVNYQLLSVSGGGGVGNARAGQMTAQERKSLLRDEVIRFKDHPALLAWYISDEPTGHGMSPDSLEADYKLIKSLDPYHPVSIVFMAPTKAREYAAAMDIVMADPYPIPNSPPASVGKITRDLRREFYAEKPVWIVPQAFGGSEHWKREPTIREISVMTWLAVSEGATGIQFFIRHGLNGFPKSTAAWGVCGQIGLQVQDIAPFLLLGDKIEGYVSQQEKVSLSARIHKGTILLIAVNEDPNPTSLKITAPKSLVTSEITVLHENRLIIPQENILEDMIDGYGTRIYLISDPQNQIQETKGNLIVDPGFEDISSPGVPASCYARVGKDPGATYFLDALSPYEGRHSLRLITPADNSGTGLSFFPVRLEGGTGYTLSVMARFDPASKFPVKRTFFQKIFGKNIPLDPQFLLSAGSHARETLPLTADWKRHTIHFRVPENSKDPIPVNPYLELVSQGKAWFDLLELRPDPLIEYGINPETKRFEVRASTNEENAVLRFTLDGSVPGPLDMIMDQPLVLNRTTRFAIGLFVQDQLVNYSTRTFDLHKAVGRKPVYETLYNPNYSAGGEFGLVDGIRGSRDYQDGRWQGFMKRDLDALIDLGSQELVSRISVGCLQDIRSWIFMPVKVEFWGSPDGKTLIPLGSITNAIDQRANGAIREDFSLQIAPVAMRFVRVKVTNTGLCPDWHKGKGNAAYLFVDEIVVE